MFSGGVTHGTSAVPDKEELFNAHLRPVVIREGAIPFVPATPTIYGIWLPEGKFWMLDENGVIFHTPYLQVALAQLQTGFRRERLVRGWEVAIIGYDGLPDREAMKKLGID